MILNNTFIILQNDSGMYYPRGNVETIQNWNYKSGYAIKVNNPVTFKIDGKIPTDRSIQISVGWNMLPVLSDQPVDLEEFFQPYLSNVQLIKELAGYHIYWPDMGINNLPRLLPGKAYNLKSTGNFEVSF